MNKNYTFISKTMGELQEGDIIRNYGYEFIVSEVKHELRDNKPCTYYKGVCTENPDNDDIRKTSYNGGWYGGLDILRIATLKYN